MNNNKIIDETRSRQAEAGDPGDRGLRGPRDPGVPCLRGGGHAPDADIILPVVPQPMGGGERGDRGVRDPMNKTLFFGSDRSLRCHNVCLSVHHKVFGNTKSATLLKESEPKIL